MLSKAVKSKLVIHNNSSKFVQPFIYQLFYLNSTLQFHLIPGFLASNDIIAIFNFNIIVNKNFHNGRNNCIKEQNVATISKFLHLLPLVCPTQINNHTVRSMSPLAIAMENRCIISRTTSYKYILSTPFLQNLLNYT